MKGCHHHHGELRTVHARHKWYACIAEPARAESHRKVAEKRSRTRRRLEILVGIALRAQQQGRGAWKLWVRQDATIRSDSCGRYRSQGQRGAEQATTASSQTRCDRR